MLTDTVYATITGANASEKHDEHPPNFVRHLCALTATKLADGLTDPKLILPWLLNALGAPGYVIGSLVPVREAGALLPQLVMARWIEARAIRKWFWAGGAALQGLAALGIAAAALFLQGAQAGWVILSLLALLAVARSSCSASHKDILARTLPKGTRGTMSGAAGTLAGVAVLGFACALSAGVIPRNPTAIAASISIAGLLWLMSAAIFAGIKEPKASPQPSTHDAICSAVAPLREDKEFRHYVATRALLIATALAPPFLVLLGGQFQADANLGNLGLLVLASSLATIASSYLWGRQSDRSSRWTLIGAAGVAAGVFSSAAIIGALTGGLGGDWGAALFIFLAQIAYEGVRAGRKTHLTDMDTDGRKSLYTALSNTMIGVLLLAGGGFGLIADLFGPAIVLAIFAVMSGCGLLVAFRLKEVRS